MSPRESPVEFNSLSRDSTPRARRSCPENTRHSLCCFFFRRPSHPMSNPAAIFTEATSRWSFIILLLLQAPCTSLHCWVLQQSACTEQAHALLFKDQPRMGGLNQERGGMAMLAGGSSRTRVCLCCLISAGQFQLVPHHHDHEMAINRWICFKMTLLAPPDFAAGS